MGISNITVGSVIQICHIYPYSSFAPESGQPSTTTDYYLHTEYSTPNFAARLKNGLWYTLDLLLLTLVREF